MTECGFASQFVRPAALRLRLLPDRHNPAGPAADPRAIAYACANGAHLLVEFVGDEARVAVIGGPSMVLPRAGEDYFSNGRYAIRGGAAHAQWEVGRAAPVNCRGN